MARIMVALLLLAFTVAGLGLAARAQEEPDSQAAPQHESQPAPASAASACRPDRLLVKVLPGFDPATVIARVGRTIVDLRDPSECVPDAAPRPAGLTTVVLPLEDLTDTAFWERWRQLSGTPLYYRAFLEQWPERFAAALAAIAEAAPGGVLLHCA